MIWNGYATSAEFRAGNERVLAAIEANRARRFNRVAIDTVVQRLAPGSLEIGYFGDADAARDWPRQR
jgi:hypothetical protein